MREFFKAHWRKVALFIFAGLAAGFVAIGQPEAAAVINLIRGLLGL